jgi:hypothetical protein
MKEFYKPEELPEKEEILLTKDVFGWKVAHPVKVDGKWNWGNFLFGGKRNAFTLLIYLFIIAITAVGVNELISGCHDVAENPCEYCKSYEINAEVRKDLGFGEIPTNLPELGLGDGSGNG